MNLGKELPKHDIEENLAEISEIQYHKEDQYQLNSALSILEKIGSTLNKDEFKTTLYHYVSKSTRV